MYLQSLGNSHLDGMNYVSAVAEKALCHDDLKRVFAASATCFNRLYIHGGTLEGAGKLLQPLCDILLFDHGNFVNLCFQFRLDFRVEKLKCLSY